MTTAPTARRGGIRHAFERDQCDVTVAAIIKATVIMAIFFMTPAGVVRREMEAEHRIVFADVQGFLQSRLKEAL